MKVDDLIIAEFQLYLKRYAEYEKSNKSDEIAEMMTAESERILKQLFILKTGADITSDSGYLKWVSFMAELGARFK